MSFLLSPSQDDGDDLGVLPFYIPQADAHTDQQDIMIIAVELSVAPPTLCCLGDEQSDVA